MMYVQVFGMKKTLAKLYGIEMGLIDMTVPLKKVKKYIEGMMKERFEQGGHAPHKWPKPSDTTMKLREVNKTKQPLIDRGNLKRAVSSPRSRYAKHTVFKNSLRFGISSMLRNNGAFYPEIMDKGATVKNGWGKGITIRIPRRRFMYLRKKDDKEIEQIMHRYMEWLVAKPI